MILVMYFTLLYNTGTVLIIKHIYCQLVNAGINHAQYTCY